MPTPESLLPIIGQLEGSDRAAAIQSQRLRRPVTPDQVVSPMGAVGRYQVMPATAKALGFDPALLTDPAHNEGAAKAAISDLIRQHGDDTEAIIVGYNASPAVVNKWKKNGRNINFLPAETRGYLERARAIMASSQTEPEVESGPKGLVDYQRLIDAGYPQAQADQWKMQTIGKLQAGGFSQSEIDKYFGTTEHKTVALNEVVQGNISHNWTPEDAVEATTPLGALAAGWDMSTAALALGGPPKTILPENAGMMADVLYGMGQFAGDIPASVLGFMGGAAAGSGVSGPAAPVVGTAAAFAGSAALPEAMRQVLMDQYRNGEFGSFSDFVSRSASMAWETAKAGVVGAVGGTAGRAVGGKVIEKAGAGMLATSAEMVTFAGASTATGGALNGRVPDAQDFATAVATMLGGAVAFKVVGAGGRMVMSRRGEEVAQNMQKVYAKTGIPPWEQARRSSGDPIMKQEILSQDADGSVVTPTMNRVKPKEPEPFKKPSASKTFTTTPGAIAGEHALEVAQIEREAAQAVAAKRPPIVSEEPLAVIHENDVIIPQGVGLNHVNPDIAQRYGFDPASLSNPEYNTKAANAILDDLSKQFKNADGSVDQPAVLIGYVAGPGRAIRYRADGRQFNTLPVPVQRYMLQAERMGAFESGGGGGKKPPPPGGAGGGADDGTPRLEGPEQVDPIELNSQMLAERINEITARPVKESLLDRARKIPEQAYFEAVSELAPFKRLDKEMGLKPDEIGLEDMYRSTYASPGRAVHFIRYGTLKPLDITEEGKAVHFVKSSDDYLFKGYEEAKKVGVSIEEVVAYRRAARTIDLAKRGIETPTDIKDATAMVEKLRGKMQPIVEMFDRVNDAKLDYMRDSGLLSPEGAQTIKDQNRHWIPYNPAREGGYRRTGTRFGPTDTIKKIKGGKYQTVDPIVQEAQSFYNAVANADKNRAAVSLLTRLTPEAREAIGLREITDQRTKPEIFDKYGNPIEEIEKSAGKLGEDQFAYFDNGERRVMQVNNPTLARAIRGASPMEVDLLWRSLHFFAAVKRSGIVDMPDYMARAMIKDSVGAAVLEKWGGANLAQIYDAASHVIKGDAIWKDWVAKGGLGTALADIDANYIARDVNKLFTESGTWDRVINTARHPLQAAGILMQRMDAIVRLAEAEKMKGAGIDPFKATMNARKINLDFSERGASATINLMSSITPFFRPAMLGMEQLARTVKNDPLGVLVRAGTYVAAPTALLYAMNYVQEQSDPTIPEDQKWANLPRWQKDTMFMLPRIGGVRLRVPMPPIIGPTFGGLTNRLLDYFAQSDPRAFHDWALTMWAQFVPPLVPAVALPIYEHWANKNSFSGKPLVPDALEGASGYMQYVDYTSETAKKIAQWVGPPGANLVDVSPIVLDNYVRQWTGPMGYQIMRVVDATAFPETGKPWEFADIPIIGSFTVRNPGMSAQTIQDFYDNLKEVRKHNINLSLSLKRQDLEEFDLASANTLAFLKLESIAESLSSQRGVIDAINKDATMPIDDKRQLIETIYSQMIAESGFGLAIVDSMADYEQGGAPPVNMLQTPSAQMPMPAGAP